MRLLVDSDILIDVLRSEDKAANFLEVWESEATIAISVVTEMEVLAGCRNKQEFAHTSRFLGRFEWVGLDPEIDETASQLFRTYRLSHGLMIPDCLIAATALTLKIPLATKNHRDFHFIDGLRRVPYGESA
ncbi:Ribonuclease VapC [Gammaproteobacteria bacterium]